MNKNDVNQSGVMVYKRLLRYLSGYWKPFTFSVLAMLIVASTGPLFTWLTKPLIDKGFVEKDAYYTLVIPLAIVALFLIRGIANYLNEYLTTYLSGHLVQKLREELFDKVLKLPISYFKSEPPGKVISKILNDANQITEAGFNVITVLAKDGVMILGLLGLLIYLDWQLTLITFIAFPVVAICVRLVSKKLRGLSRLNQKFMGDMTQILTESVDGVKEIKIYHAFDKVQQRFHFSANSVRNNLLKQISINSISTAITQLMVAVALAVIIYFAGLRAQTSFTAGSFMSFLTAMIMMFDPIKRLTTIMQSLQRGIAAAESIFSFLDLSEEVDAGTLEFKQLAHGIEFKNINFSYPDSDSLNLEQINLLIPKGSVVALVGTSGCGKSTLANLLPRFFDINSGSILFDGIDIKDFELTSIRNAMSMVSQEVILFNDTIMNNVAYGSDALDGDEKRKGAVISALKLANAWSFIEQLPEGMNTIIGENGAKLSGGQRQRIAIARALLKNAPILILDEATSALDIESEKQVQNALDRLMENRTTLVIAHRLATIEKADIIVVMHEGKIIEMGNHQKLLEKKGRYSLLYQMQFS